MCPPCAGISPHEAPFDEFNEVDWSSSLGYGSGKLTGMNTAKRRTISIEVGMQNAGLATNLATTSAQFANTPESAVICAVSCVWHSISGTLLAGFFANIDKRTKKDSSIKIGAVQSSH